MTSSEKQKHVEFSSTFQNIDEVCPWEPNDILKHYTYEKGVQTLTYMWNRVPNAMETATTVASTTILEMGVGEEFIKQLGSNPGNKAIFRDSVKTVSISFSWLAGSKLGGTSTKYDFGHVFGQIYKVGCKFLYIHSSYKQIAESAREANYFCDTSSRIFPLTSQLRQEENTTDLNYAYDLLKRVFTTSLIPQAVLQGLVKSSIADKIGKQIESCGIESSLCDKANIIQDGAMSLVEGRDSFSSKSILCSTEFIKKFVVGNIVSLIYTPPVRITQDLVPILSKPVEDSCMAGKDYILAKLTSLQPNGTNVVIGLGGSEDNASTINPDENTCLISDHDDSPYYESSTTDANVCMWFNELNNTISHY